MVRTLFVVAWLSAAAAALAQVEVYDTTNPFATFDRQARDDAISGEIGYEIPLRLPAAVPVRTPIKLMPNKPVLVLEEDAQADSELRRIEQERLAVIARIKERRREQDQAAVSTLLRELESLRQERLVRLRKVATPVAAPESGTPAGEGSETPDADEPAPKPVLPIPTLPEKKGR